MDERERTEIGKFLSLVLRHRPELIGIALAEGGWVGVGVLLEQCRAHGRHISRATLDEVVATNTKKRFAFSADGTRIRASQGHSVAVTLGYEPVEPPERLFHGTVDVALPGIRSHGLVRRERHDVHLSPDRETASAVGRRRGKPVILEVRARVMYGAGFQFFLSSNGVWLTERVPVEFLLFP